MSNFLEQIKAFPTLGEFIVKQFQRPLEDVVGLSLSQDMERYDDHGFIRAVPVNPTLTITFKDGSVKSASVAGMRFDYVEPST